MQHAYTLIRDIEIKRDVAMHRVGPPDPNAPAVGNAERHFERVSEFYLEHLGLRERAPLTFGEEFALVRLLGYCGVSGRWSVACGRTTPMRFSISA